MAFALRRPAVAGRFYPGRADALADAVTSHLVTGEAPVSASAALLPHAGYVYSGAVAGRTLASIVVPSTVVVLCPNHTGAGSPRALWPEGCWQVPGAEVPVDAAFAADLLASGALVADPEAHRDEHAIEVELPFLLARRRDVQLVPICLGHLSLTACLELGEVLAHAVLASRARGREALLVASSDMSHYVSAREATALDQHALEAVEAVDAAALHATVLRDRISMCGMLPTTVVLAALRHLGCERGAVVAYDHSGTVTGDYDRVVGYAGARFPGARFRDGST